MGLLRCGLWARYQTVEVLFSWPLPRLPICAPRASFRILTLLRKNSGKADSPAARQVQVHSLFCNLRKLRKQTHPIIGSLSLSTRISGAKSSSVGLGNRPVHCRIFSSIPGPYPLHAIGAHTPSCDNQECLPAVPGGQDNGETFALLLNG